MTTWYHTGLSIYGYHVSALALDGTFFCTGERSPRSRLVLGFSHDDVSINFIKAIHSIKFKLKS